MREKWVHLSVRSSCTKGVVHPRPNLPVPCRARGTLLVPCQYHGRAPRLSPWSGRVLKLRARGVLAPGRRLQWACASMRGRVANRPNSSSAVGPRRGPESFFVLESAPGGPMGEPAASGPRLQGRANEDPGREPGWCEVGRAAPPFFVCASCGRPLWPRDLGAFKFKFRIRRPRGGNGGAQR